MNRAFAGAAVITCLLVPNALAQVTGTPIFQTPYRTFTNTAYAASISFPGGADVAFEGDLRARASTFELGFRAGVLFPDPGDAVFLVGAEAKQRVVNHNESFPLDGSVVFGLGGNFGNGLTLFRIPIALTLGRRIHIKDSQVSIVPFLEPTGWITFGDMDEFLFSLGGGAEFELTPVFDLRFTFGLGDLDGIALSAIWNR